MTCEKCRCESFKVEQENNLIIFYCILCGAPQFLDLPDPARERLKNIQFRQQRRKQNQADKPAYRLIEYQGKTLSSLEWEQITGIPKGVIFTRYFKLHWPADVTLTKPVRHRTSGAIL